MSEKKIKILMLGDSPFAPSGVGTQLRYICEALLETGKFQIVNIGGAVKHTEEGKVFDMGEDIEKEIGIKNSYLKIQMQLQLVL